MKTKNTCHSELDSESSSFHSRSSKENGRYGNKFSMTKFGGFTLVELIVVITILVILGTIGFISIGGYSSNARDSTRSSDLANIAKSLDVSLIRIGYYPDPDSVFSVAYSGGTLWKQGTIGESVFTTLNAGGGFRLSKKPTDPLVSTREYSYSKTVYGNTYQLKGDWEGESITYNDVRCKMRDDKTRMKECEENLVENSSLLPSYIFHLSSFTFPKVSALPENPTLSYIKGNYNGMVARTETGSMKYLLAIPSLFLGTSASSGSTVSFSPVSSTGFLLHGQSNSSTGFVFTGVVVYSSGALPSTDAERILFASGIAHAYSGTVLASSASIKPFISAFGSSPVNTGALASLGGSVVSGSLGGSMGSSSLSGGGGGGDTTPPTGGDFTIPGTASSTSITLSVTCPTDVSAPIQVAYGNTASPTNWTTCTSSLSHTLTTGDGSKTVYVRFKDSVGNMTGDVSRGTVLNTYYALQRVGMPKRVVLIPSTNFSFTWTNYKNFCIGKGYTWARTNNSAASSYPEIYSTSIPSNDTWGWHISGSWTSSFIIPAGTYNVIGWYVPYGETNGMTQWSFTSNGATTITGNSQITDGPLGSGYGYNSTSFTDGTLIACQES